MYRFTGSLLVLFFGLSMTWAQAPAAAGSQTSAQTPAAQAPSSQQPAAQPGQPGAQPATPSTATKTPQSAQSVGGNNISGCLTETYGQFKITDTATNKSYDVMETGTPLWNDVNHVVTIQAVQDPKSAAPTVYAMKIQQAGQTCGNPQAASAQPGQTGAAATAQGTQAQSSATGAPSTTGATSTTGAASTTGTTANTTPSASTSPSSQPNANPAPAPGTGSAIGGSTGSTGSSTSTTPPPQANENKGNPNSGTTTGASNPSATPQ